MNRSRLNLGLIAVLIGLGVVLFFYTRDRISHANCARIKKGMTVAEVEDILGPGTVYPRWCDNNYLTLAWQGEELLILVSFYGPGRRVVWHGYYFEPKPSLVDRLGVWLGW